MGMAYVYPLGLAEVQAADVFDKTKLMASEFSNLIWLKFFFLEWLQIKLVNDG